MAGIGKYVSTNIENGITFDTLVGNLLAYKPELWGCTEQNYNNIATEFAVDSNSLYYLPAGNYKLENLPNSPFDSDFVNVYVFDKNGGKYIICSTGGATRYATELTSATDTIVWTDVSQGVNRTAEIVFFHIADTAPTDTTKMWVDTSKLASDNEASLKYYNGTEWVSYYAEGIMLQEVYDPHGINKDPYAAVLSEISDFFGEYAEFTKHKDNELELIHLTAEESEYYRTCLLTTADIARIFAENGPVYDQMIEYIGEKSKEISGYADIETGNSEAMERFDEHTQIYDVTWNAASISKTHREWHSICYGNGKYVVIASSSNIVAYSEDGVTWIERPIGSTDRYWYSVCYGEDKFVAVAAGSNVFAYSYDGITWTEGTISETIRDWHCVCYGNGTYVALACESSVFAYSHDGITWYETTVSGTSRFWYDICYGGDKFVAVAYASHVFAYSTDGITWHEVDSGVEAREWQSVCYGDGKYIAVASSSNVFAYSTDGMTWYETNLGLSVKNWFSVCYGDDIYIAVAIKSNTFVYSFDGIHWLTGMLSEDEKLWWNIYYNHGTYMIVESNSSSISYSADEFGFSHISAAQISFWDSKAAPDHKHEFDENVIIDSDNIDGSDGSLIPSEYLDSAKERSHKIDSIEILANTPTEEELIGIYHNGNILYTEDEAGNTEWYNITDNSKFGQVGFTARDNIITKNNYYCYYVCYGNGKFVTAVPGTKIFMYSTDGITWTEVAINGMAQYWTEIFYANGRFTAIAAASTMFAYSDDGINWTQAMLVNDPNTWHSGCYGNGRFVILSHSDVFVHSVDGLAWTQGTMGSVPRIWSAVCYGNGKFIAVDSNSSVYAYSTDGVTWFEGNINDATNGYTDVIYCNDRFIAAGTESSIAYSLDGNTWQTVKISAAPLSLKAVCYCDEKYVVIGSDANGAQLYGYSTDCISWVVKYLSIDSTTNFNDIASDGSMAVAVSKTTQKSLVFGVMPLYEEGFAHMSSVINSLRFDHIKNTPTTLEGYGISEEDVATKEEYINVVSTYEQALYFNYTPIGYDVAAVTAPDSTIYPIYLGIQKTRFTHGGGNAKNPMSTATSDLDVIMVVDKDGALSNTVSKFNCESIKLWNESTISNSVREWSEVCYGNGMFVAVAVDSTIFAYSSDGINWTEATISDTEKEWWTLCYGNGKFVAVAKYSNTIAYSANGINWTEVTVSATERPWWAICYGNNKFVMLSSGENVCAYSTDGVTWIEAAISDIARYWYSVCYGNGMFVAIAAGDNIFAYSYDGINWTEGIISDTKRDWHTVCYGGGKFVIIACDSNIFAYSDDGIIWHETIVSNTPRAWYHGCYGDDKFVAVDYASNGCVYSNDGINWYESAINEAVDFWYSIAYGNGLYVTVATDSNKVASATYFGSYLYSEPGLSKHETLIPASKYFNTYYFSDSVNPEWDTEGLGRMLRVDTSVDNLVMNETYNINGSEYVVTIRWDSNVGIVFDISMGKAIRSLQTIRDNFVADQATIVNKINTLAAILNENGADVHMTW